MVNCVWFVWIVCSEKPVHVAPATLFVRRPSEGRRWYETVVYLPVAVKKSTAAALFSDCFSVDHARGRVLSLKCMLSVFGPGRTYHDAFDYVERDGEVIYSVKTTQ